MHQSTMGRCHAVGIALLTLCYAGCVDAGRGVEDGIRWTEWDSVGVIIVDNEPPAPESRLGWSIGAQPSISIGSVDSGEANQLFAVTDATRLSDGRIVVANSGSNELRVFNPDGSHAGTWGGQGEGPGEFTSYSPTAVLSWPGDSVAAPNPWALRMSIFDTDGNHGRDISLGGGFPDFVDLLPNGRILARAPNVSSSATGSGGTARWEDGWGILAADGALHASLGIHPGSEFHAVFGPDGTIQGGRPLPFARGAMGTAWGEFAAIGVSDSYEIKGYAADGTLARIIRRGGDLGSPTWANVEALYTELYAGMPDEQVASALNDARDLPLVEAFPAFSEIVADLSGNLWVQEYQMPGETAVVWTVFDPDGRIQGLIEIPHGLEVFEIGEEYVLGRVRDELGVEYVQVWPLSRIAR